MEKQLTLKAKGARFSFLLGLVAEKEELKNYQDLIDNQWELLNLFYPSTQSTTALAVGECSLLRMSPV